MFQKTIIMYFINKIIIQYNKIVYIIKYFTIKVNIFNYIFYYGAHMYDCQECMIKTKQKSLIVMGWHQIEVTWLMKKKIVEEIKFTLYYMEIRKNNLILYNIKKSN